MKTSNHGLSTAIVDADLDGLNYDLDCGTCKACCFGLDGPTVRFDERRIFKCHETEKNVFRLNTNKEWERDGLYACVYLTEEGCSIYEYRPAVCRKFDCRSLIITKESHVLDEWIQQKFLLEEVIQQGKIRMMQFNEQVVQNAVHRCTTPKIRDAREAGQASAGGLEEVCQNTAKGQEHFKE